ncbi:MAG TPA: hypothetical protein PLD25_30995 [Chloroflexota bacterium]|nr:hypothetical protein [Chloroflexota bacterium]HUM67581.1 hypothetical protein [Chloroflexota bacterium]
MNSTLSFSDPLAEQEVTIIITLAASDCTREERAALISVGVAEQSPVIKMGLFADLPALINEAWNAFGVQAQMSEAAQAVETVAEEQLVATVNIIDDEPEPTPQPHLSTPKPQAKNLSLF